MSIFSRLAFKNLKANKNRTLITIVGIILATAMICGLTSLISSFQNYFYRDAKMRNGSWHVTYELTNEAQMREVLEDEAVKNVLTVEQKGYAYFDNKNDYKPYLYLIGLDSNDLGDAKNREMFPIYMQEGSLPQNEHEIILPDHLLSRTEHPYKIGDTITLNVGYRYPLPMEESDFSQDEFSKISKNGLFQNDPLQTDIDGEKTEEICDSREQTYTITGFYSRSDLEPYSAPGYMAITKSNQTEADINNLNIKQYYIELHNYKDVGMFIENHPLNNQVYVNTEMLRYLGFSLNDGFNAMLYSLSSIFYILIIVASVVLISNAFTISLSERIKQFGLLSSIGASKKQLRKSIYAEAMMICLISLPIGILGGLGGIYITLRVIEDLFNSTIVLSPMVSLTLYVSWQAVLITVVLTIITVLISAYIPAKKASKITAIEAIRQTKSLKGKPIKVGKFTRKVFGLSGFLATKYYKQNKAKYRSTIVSLALSIILFISAYTFTALAKGSIQNLYNNTSTDIKYMIDLGEKSQVPDIAEIKNDLVKIKGVDRVKTVFSGMNFFIVNQDDYTPEAIDFYEKHPEYSAQEISNQHYLEQLNIFFVEDDEFNEMLTKIGLDASEYQALSADTCYPLVYNKNFMPLDNGTFGEFELFKTDREIDLLNIKEIPDYNFSHIDITDDNQLQLYYFGKTHSEKVIPFEEGVISQEKVSLQYFIDELPQNLKQNAENQILFFPISLKDQLPTQSSYRFLSYLIETDESQHYQVANTLSDYLQEKSLNSEMIDFYQMQDMNKSMIKIVNIFCYGFIILITLIALTNVLNTITTNINLRKQDFAMLRSIGLSNKDFKRMTLFECLLYGTRSILYGLPIAVFISILIQKAFGHMFEKALFIPWTAILISIVVIFIFVYCTMLMSMSKVKKANIVETLKNQLD